MRQPVDVSPFCLESFSGLTARLTANGALQRLDYKNITLNLFPGNEVEGGPTNIYLRQLGDGVEVTPLLGPGSPSVFGLQEGSFIAQGEWCGIRYQLRLVLAASTPAWFWHVTLENAGEKPLSLELIYTQDLALAPYGINEYFVSQYLDHTALEHPQQGRVLATRQNQPMNGQIPWCLIGSLDKAASYATDALQVFGFSGRTDGTPSGIMAGLPGERLQQEHAMAALQDAAVTLAPGQSLHSGFFGWLETHHPLATSADDLRFVDLALALPERIPGSFPTCPGLHKPVLSLFDSCPAIASIDFDDGEVDRFFGPERREEERVNGQLFSFFSGRRGHVVLKAKELAVLRPHGHILRTGGVREPDESSLTSTVWMDGVFHSMVTQGHVSINRFLTTTRSYLSLFKSQGLRVFVDAGEGWQRLALPSAFVMCPESCRWLYKYAGGVIEVRSEAMTDRHELTLDVIVLEGAPIRCLLSFHIALNGDDPVQASAVLYQRQGNAVRVHAPLESDVGRRFPEGCFLIEPQSGTLFDQVGTDELLFADGESRNQPYLCMMTPSARNMGLKIPGHLLESAELPSMTADAYWRENVAGLTVNADAPEVARRMAEILPWFAHNALIHFLSPRGLEQYGGGGWGTRDVTQGPVEYLLAVGQFSPIRDLLLRVFRSQNPDGDWPQWFMFFERERSIRPDDSHGDIIFWPLLALAQYLIVTGDAEILREPTPFFSPNPEEAESPRLWQHVECALELIHQRIIPGTHLAAYGHGDWNDSLQPVDPAQRERMCSAWTVTLHYQVLTTLARALGRIGQAEPAGVLESMADRVLADFHEHLMVDGVVTGYAHFEANGDAEYLLHPRDRKTGLSYSLLPMMHAILNDMLSPEEATQQLDLIREHLHGPDGAHLFDRPMVYRGGPMTLFQRAESSSFFGREIGNMYTHAHLRYAEALWYVGQAEAFFEALSQAVPIHIQTVVPTASHRQANCYYSSSDAAFQDRYQAYAEYDRVLSGEVKLEGGWRVYSSGAGIATSLILRRWLGISLTTTALVVDPVMPRSMDGLSVTMDIEGYRFDITYQVELTGSGPHEIELNGAKLAFRRLQNPYRLGAAEIQISRFRDARRSIGNRMIVRLG